MTRRRRWCIGDTPLLSMPWNPCTHYLLDSTLPPLTIGEPRFGNDVAASRSKTADGQCIYLSPLLRATQHGPRAFRRIQCSARPRFLNGRISRFALSDAGVVECYCTVVVALALVSFGKPKPGRAFTIFTVSRLTVITWPIKRRMYSLSSSRLGSLVMPERLSVET
jgi:hypothetical protein